MLSKFGLITLGLSTTVHAGFRVYDGFPSQLIQVAYGLTDQCLQAL